MLPVHTDNRKNELILGEEPTGGLHDTKITAAAKYSVYITNSRQKICLSLHYNVANSFLFANGVKVYQFKAKYSEIKSYPLYLGKRLKLIT